MATSPSRSLLIPQLGSGMSKRVAKAIPQVPLQANYPIAAQFSADDAGLLTDRLGQVRMKPRRNPAFPTSPESSREHEEALSPDSRRPHIATETSGVRVWAGGGRPVYYNRPKARATARWPGRRLPPFHHGASFGCGASISRCFTPGFACCRFITRSRRVLAQMERASWSLPQDRTVQVWKEDPERPLVHIAHTDRITVANFSRDGKSSSRDRWMARSPARTTCILHRWRMLSGSDFWRARRGQRGGRGPDGSRLAVPLWHGLRTPSR